MKIGFSFGRCLRDIVSGKVKEADILFIISSTHVETREDIIEMVDVYLGRRDYLSGYDRNDCVETACRLLDNKKVIQPRKEGIHRFMVPTECVWVDLYPTVVSDNSAIKSAWESYRMLLQLVEKVPAKGDIRDGMRMTNIDAPAPGYGQPE